jgi:hypothetical protein
LNKIIAIGDGNTSMPIHWNLSPTNVLQHNAIAMGVAISRGIDEAHLWDGTLYASDFFDVGSILNSDGLNVVTLSDSVTVTTISPTLINLSQAFSAVDIDGNTLDCANISDSIILQRVPVASYSGSTTITLTFINPIGSTSTIDTSAFSVSGILSGTYTEIPIVSAVANNTILTITTNDFSAFTGNIQINYEKSTGNLINILDGTETSSFSVYFNKT